MSDIHDRVKAQFSKAAKAYVQSSIHAKGKDLELMVNLAGDLAEKTVLDIATGGGHTALAFAKAGARVTASDLTPTMLETAQNFIVSQGFKDLSYVEAAAEALPFEAHSFDVVTCRIAPHHFAEVSQFVREVARVLKRNGSFLLIDNIAPENKALSEVMNYVEKTRDPSHVKAYSFHEWLHYLLAAGLEPHYFLRFERNKDWQEWVANAQMPEAESEKLERYILSLPENQKTYLNVKEEAGRLLSLSHEVALIQAKPMLQ
ncbi:MAG: methyltransferase domain-containing protein [Trueperaceae bacterium]|nr:methyltransferase domain-containing protein [Trueperaceae bacterium]